MTTPRLILCPPSDTALARLNDARELDGKLRTERKRYGDHTPTYRALEEQFDTACIEFTEAILAGAVYVDDTDDPRVAALEARVRELETYKRLLHATIETHYGKDALLDTMTKALALARAKDAVQEARDGE